MLEFDFVFPIDCEYVICNSIECFQIFGILCFIIINYDYNQYSYQLLNVHFSYLVVFYSFLKYIKKIIYHLTLALNKMQ